MKAKDWVAQFMDGVQWMSSGEVLCFCPLHTNTDSPAMNINYVKMVFICRGCGESGTLMALAEKIGHPLIPSFDLDDVAANAARLRSKMEAEPEAEPVGHKSEAWLNQFVKRRHPYWRERGITDSVRREWQLGYDRAKDAVTVPLHSLNGSVLGVIRRSLTDDHGHRWRYPSGFRQQLHLFASHRLRVLGNEPLVIVEGSIDCIRVWMAGTPCVAVLGASFSAHQQNIVRKVAGDRILVFMDNDEAGRAAQGSIEDRLLQDGYTVCRVPYPRSLPQGATQPKDPGAMTLNQLKRSLGASQEVRKLRVRRSSRMV